MVRKESTTLLHVTLVALLIITLSYGPIPMALAHECNDCHASATPSAADLIQNLQMLCADCHVERIAAGEHVVNVAVQGSFANLPIQAGMMTCITCHDPHGAGVSLRMTAPALCDVCHKR